MAFYYAEKGPLARLTHAALAALAALAAALSFIVLGTRCLWLSSLSVRSVTKSLALRSTET